MSDATKRIVSLILVEGDTEEEFYSRLARDYLGGIPKVIRNLKGNYNIYSKVLDKVAQYSEEHDDHEINVYVCIDQEKPGRPIFDPVHLEGKLKLIRNFRNLYPVIAVLMLESLFFIDIENIYTFLRMPHKMRNPGKYASFRTLRHQDLSKVFDQADKIYQKGVRCRNLIDNLDMDKIINGASELKNFVETIKAGK